jgi:DNA ligase-1
VSTLSHNSALFTRIIFDNANNPSNSLCVSSPQDIQLSPVKELHLTDADLWLDARMPKPHCFVSHAHADHVARHQQILCSPITAHLLQARYGITRDRLLIIDFHHPLPWKHFLLTLLPAGHIAGSSMLHVVDLHHGTSLLYTGDYKLRPSRSIETAAWMPADTLIMESTFGLPRFVLPAAADIEQQICDFIDQALADGETPVLLGYSLGKAQEIAAILDASQRPYQNTTAVTRMTEACREAGLNLSAPEPWMKEIPKGYTLIAEPQFLRSKKFSTIDRPRTAIMTGWALQSSAKFRYGTDAAIPLSDHADFPDLLRTTDIVKPKKIITIHGYTRELATTLRSKNHNAWSHYGNDQLELW